MCKQPRRGACAAVSKIYNGETDGVHCFCSQNEHRPPLYSGCAMAARIHHHRRNENAITTVVCKATNPVVVVPVVRVAALEDGDRDTPPFTPFAYLSQMFKSEDAI